jgi:transposase
MPGRDDIETCEKNRRQLQGLPVIRRNVAGIDLGSERHWVCAPTLDGSSREIASFGATTPELIGMAEWLKERQVESVAMESTGVYWIAPHEVLEGQGLQLLLVDTRQLARVPGRDKKTDPTDCEWIQRLHSCGLLRGSFRPEEAVCLLRTLVRDKANLVAESGDWLRRMQKGLDQRNVRVHRAVSDIDGVTGMAILRAIAGGERDALQLAKLRDPRCSKTEQEIAEPLSGHWREDHLFSLQQALKMYDAVQERMAAYEKEILRRLGEMEREEQRGQTASAEQQQGKGDQKTRPGAEAAGVIPNERRRSHTHRCHRSGNGRSGAQRVRPRFEPLPHGEAVCLARHLGAACAQKRR